MPAGLARPLGRDICFSKTPNSTHPLKCVNLTAAASKSSKTRILAQLSQLHPCSVSLPTSSADKTRNCDPPHSASDANCISCHFSPQFHPTESTRTSLSLREKTFGSASKFNTEPYTPSSHKSSCFDSTIPYYWLPLLSSNSFPACPIYAVEAHTAGDT